MQTKVEYQGRTYKFDTKKYPWIAMDSDGSVYAYDSRPIFSKEITGYIPSEQGKGLVCLVLLDRLSPKQIKVDWKDSICRVGD